MGARLILSPSAWAIQPGKEAENIGWIAGTYAKRTAGRKLVIASANCVGRVTEGPWRGRILQGNSLIVGPDGRMALKGPTSVPALLVRDLIL
jgi:predicted amidohydrolase